ncbi:hypothetical protein [Sphingomonas sp. ID0503]|uniref:hypothetical protein n=1 Tax=Sphingomonas sp. ID0503 TaxID=3399691 RepID=UPI003AFA1B2D
MQFDWMRRAGAAAAITGILAAAPASAQMFWNPPSFAGTPVKGDEPGIGLPMPGATAKELSAHLIWNMRAGLNVAALQCQFAPMLMTVRNYNHLLAQHSKEFAAAYTMIGGYFKRTQPKTWQKSLDSYTTKTYNGFSTLKAQLSFCQVASSIGQEALMRPKGQLLLTAENRMREFRNSLIPVQDRLFPAARWLTPQPVPPLDDRCYDRKNRLKASCGGQA